VSRIVSWGEASVRDAVRRFNKLVINPVVVRVAGRRYWSAAVIHHRGRSSGREYATPVFAEAVHGGFLIPLPYGTKVDWLRNVLAAGQATLEVYGKTFKVQEPVVVSSGQALPLLSSARAVWWRLMRMGSFLQVATAPVATPGQRAALRKRPATESVDAPRTTPHATAPRRRSTTPVS
jgi:deazaflavin-dependent oxidoreductase (nitroreductase family)